MSLQRLLITKRYKPRWPFGSFLRMQASALPEGVVMSAVSVLMSYSFTESENSLAVPMENCDLSLLSPEQTDRQLSSYHHNWWKNFNATSSQTSSTQVLEWENRRAASMRLHIRSQKPSLTCTNCHRSDCHRSDCHRSDCHRSDCHRSDW